MIEMLNLPLNSKFLLLFPANQKGKRARISKFVEEGPSETNELRIKLYRPCGCQK